MKVFVFFTTSVCLRMHAYVKRDCVKLCIMYLNIKKILPHFNFASSAKFRIRNDLI